MAKKKREKQDPSKASDNYIDNKEFLREMVEWKKICHAEEQKGNSIPPMTESIGAKIMLIAEGMAKKSNFSQYTYRDEMILDAIENCVRYGKNFNPDKSPNPFSYFSTIVYHAFIRRIQREKREAAKKKKIIELAIDDPMYRHDLDASNTSAGALAELQKKLSAETAAYEESVKKPTKKKSSKKMLSSSTSTPLF